MLKAVGEYSLNNLAKPIGAWLGSVVSLLDPDIIVIGGGVSKIGEPLFEKLREIVPQRTVNPHASELPIVPAKFGAESGIVGAAAVMMRRSPAALLGGLFSLQPPIKAALRLDEEAALDRKRPQCPDWPPYKTAGLYVGRAI